MPLPVVPIFVFPLSFSLSISLMIGALGMVFTKVIDIDDAYKSISWSTVFLLAGLIPL